jgi:DNA-directed RNA polymerase specialized sigma24 family protein
MNADELDAIRGIARRIRHNKNLLGYSWEDLAQDVAIRAWQSASTMRTDNWRGWVSAIARQRNQERHRRETVRLHEVQATRSEYSASTNTPAEVAAWRELLAMPRRKVRRTMGW